MEQGGEVGEQGTEFSDSGNVFPMRNRKEKEAVTRKGKRLTNRERSKWDKE